MVMIALFSLLVGAVLGTRFKIHVLLPVTLLGFALIAAGSVFQNFSVSSLIATALLQMVSLQFGYLGGLFTRYCLVAVRLSTPGNFRLPSTQR